MKKMHALKTVSEPNTVNQPCFLTLISRMCSISCKKNFPLMCRRSQARVYHRYGGSGKMILDGQKNENMFATST